MYILPAVLNGKELIKLSLKKFLGLFTKKNIEITSQIKLPYKSSIVGEKS
jgi:hypothetical protein